MVRSSRVYETEPVGPPQPAYLNAVIQVDTTLTPRELLESALGVEDSLGRVRAERWGPRTIDVDILVYDERTVDEPDLVDPAPEDARTRVRPSPARRAGRRRDAPGRAAHVDAPAGARCGVRCSPVRAATIDRAGMNETVCFRCDWQGRARTRTCPSCGAPLYRPDREDVARDPDAFDLDEARVGEVASRRPGPRGRSVAIAVAVAIATVGSIELFAAVSETARPPGREGVVRSGAIVYAVDDGEGGSTLWTVDLLMGMGRPGPSIRPGRRSSSTCPPPLRDDRCRTTGSRSDGRRRRAGHLRRRRHRPARERRPHRVGTGWREPRLRPQRTDRTRRVRAGQVLRLVTVLTEKVEWALDDPGFCGPILSLSRSQAATYFSAASGDRLSVYLTGTVGVPHLTFEGVGMLSAAPPAAFLLRPDASPRPRAAPRERPARCSVGKGSVAR